MLRFSAFFCCCCWYSQCTRVHAIRYKMCRRAVPYATAPPYSGIHYTTSVVSTTALRADAGAGGRRCNTRVEYIHASGCMRSCLQTPTESAFRRSCLNLLRNALHCKPHHHHVSWLLVVRGCGYSLAGWGVQNIKWCARALSLRAGLDRFATPPIDCGPLRALLHPTADVFSSYPSRARARFTPLLRCIIDTRL